MEEYSRTLVITRSPFHVDMVRTAKNQSMEGEFQHRESSLYDTCLYTPCALSSSWLAIVDNKVPYFVMKIYARFFYFTDIDKSKYNARMIVLEKFPA